MNFTPHARPNLFTAPGGYAIRRDGEESPAYWFAYRPGSDGKPCIDPQHEIGAGAGHEGWLKCVRLCETHSQPAIGVSQNGNSPPKTCESSSNTESQLQQGLDL